MPWSPLARGILTGAYKGGFDARLDRALEGRATAFARESLYRGDAVLRDRRSRSRDRRQVRKASGADRAGVATEQARHHCAGRRRVEDRATRSAGRRDRNRTRRRRTSPISKSCIAPSTTCCPSARPSAVVRRARATRRARRTRLDGPNRRDRRRRTPESSRDRRPALPIAVLPRQDRPSVHRTSR